MPTLNIYEVEAFGGGHAFKGNPAAVVPLDAFPDDATLQTIAAANNLSETAFFAPDAESGTLRLRWFTPTVEVKLCGHATLATGFVIMTILEPHLPAVTFDSASGLLAVTKSEDVLALDFPSRASEAIEPVPGLAEAVGATPMAYYRSDENLVAEFATAADVAALAPDFRALKGLTQLGLIATAPGKPGNGVDFVSRFFAPAAGIDEDPVTGSAHCTLAPFWAGRLGKNRLEARQISARGGFLTVEDHGSRVTIAGKCRLYLKGEIDTGTN